MTQGGSISAGHSIGIAKREWLPRVKDKVALQVMRSLKTTLDPSGILNPGKMLQGSCPFRADSVEEL